ncbi:ferritin family protein [Anaeromicrobium sediminis]|uniref:Metal-iron-binding protein n=1 Tax=Anaeromicrobium sediminis TaxID=1478221 RepID=A0A267MMC8_9FIRM|nr:ferritin family protein [Anaeromicrobium sediminis]PAB60696.1 metal-iron-binding protein [Anaeromicrobium sediminis]
MEQLKCLICGMNINLKNYRLNENTFLEKNEEEHIINCPFCGVGKVYLDNNKALFKVESKELDEETLKVLDKAMKLEVFNGEFYKEASELAKNNEIKELFKELSSVEFMHARVHKMLGGFKEMPKLHKPDYTKYDSDDLLLEEARKREKHAIEFYNKNSKVVCSNVVKEVLKALSHVEKQHEIIAESRKEKTLEVT